MSIKNLSSDIKSLFYKDEEMEIPQNDLLQTDDLDLDEFDFTSKELYLTLDKNPNMPDEEIFEFFPEFGNNQDVLEEAKKRANIFGGDTLKKKKKISYRKILQKIQVAQA